MTAVLILKSAANFFFFNNTPPAGVNGPIICVDVNGYQRPNTFGRDIFVFQFTTDNLVIPMGQKHRTNIQPGDEGFNDNQQFFYEGETYCSRAATKPLFKFCMFILRFAGYVAKRS